MTYERALRGLSLVTTAIAFPLAIASTVVSIHQERRGYSWYYNYRPVTAMCFSYIPLFATLAIAVASLIYHRKQGRMPGSRFVLLDLFGSLAYIGVLVPIWAIDVGRLSEPGWGLLAGYTTSPMIVNMFIHIFFVIYNVQSLASRFAIKGVHECPNCHNSFTVSQAEAPKPAQKQEGYSLLRGEVYLEDEEEAAPYADLHSPVSEPAAPKEEGKGKAILDV